LKTFATLLQSLSSIAWPQQMSHRLNNKDIIDMVALGLSDDVIIAKIRSAAKPEDLAFDTSTEGLKQLKAAHVSDAVMKVMINPAAAPPAATATSGITPIDDLDLPPAGVCWKDGSKFVQVEGQILSQAKVGGRAGSTFTYGLRAQHWDAYVDGSTSRNRIKEARPLFYFYVPDGATASDFLLIKLEKKDNRRKFQVGSFGGITGDKSGVKRDKELPFKSEHVSVRPIASSLIKPESGRIRLLHGHRCATHDVKQPRWFVGRQCFRQNLRLHYPGIVGQLSLVCGFVAFARIGKTKVASKTKNAHADAFSSLC
jgi:hypothetical protein